MSLFEAQAGMNAGLAKGRRIGHVEGYNEGYAEAKRNMMPFKKLAKTLESILVDGGLERMWKAKIVNTERPDKVSKSPTSKKRLVFLHMLAYAEYHQRHVKDPLVYLGGFTDKVDKVVAEAKRNKETGHDALLAMEALTKKITREVDGITQGQKDENMKVWINWRVDNLKKSARYKPGSIIPIRESLGKTSMTTKDPGAEIAENAFGIVDDAKKYLGQDIDIRTMGY
ncbi:MAG: hypothetical protein Q9M12_08390 [Mariprofundus sp.]|nr:hypothetical protein [Mariprofundus sp.]